MRAILGCVVVLAAHAGLSAEDKAIDAKKLVGKWEPKEKKDRDNTEEPKLPIPSIEALAKTAKLPNFQDYPMARRLADFTSIFGEDFRMLEAHFLRFMATLK